LHHHAIAGWLVGVRINADLGFTVENARAVYSY